VIITVTPGEHKMPSTCGTSGALGSQGGSKTALPHLERAINLAGQGALFAVNHSGGKDSQAVLIRVLEVIPCQQVVVVHAALGEVEWPGAMEHARRQAETAGVPFIATRAGKTLLEMVERRHSLRPEVPSWPSAQHRQCTSDLKRGPIERALRQEAKRRGATIVVNCMGIRAAESPARSKKEPWRRNASQSVAGREWFDWLPIHDLSTAEVFATIKAAGQEPHPAYGSWGNERLSCVFCILSNARDLRNGAIRNPDLYAKYVALEASTAYTAHQSRRSLVEITGLTVEEARNGGIPS
jgi:3'-phosphoadenosine 5'-phosphosulfate sulfotransferase (PAPS reductase)/FAD synthetase